METYGSTYIHYTRICEYIHTHIYVSSIYRRAHVHECVYVELCESKYMSLYVHTYMRVHTYSYICIFSIYMRAHVYECVYVEICECIYISIHLHMYMRVHIY